MGVNRKSMSKRMVKMWMAASTGDMEWEEEEEEDSDETVWMMVVVVPLAWSVDSGSIMMGG